MCVIGEKLPRCLCLQVPILAAASRLLEQSSRNEDEATLEHTTGGLRYHFNEAEGGEK